MNAYLDQLVSTHQFVLVDFHATWCEPCKWVEPILTDVEKHFGGKIILKKVDIDEYPEPTSELSILSVPTIVLFKDGAEVWRMRGFDTLAHMIEEIDKFVKRSQSSAF